MITAGIDLHHLLDGERLEGQGHHGIPVVAADAAQAGTQQRGTGDHVPPSVSNEQRRRSGRSVEPVVTTEGRPITWARPASASPRSKRSTEQGEIDGG
jgi:hypothetical protein